MGERSTTRRALLRRGALALAGFGVGAATMGELADVRDRHLPIVGGPASSTIPNGLAHPGGAQLRVTWGVRTEQRLVALTFDDGPRPQWTNMVLDTLDRHEVPATFFVVGRRVRRYAQVLDGRIARHELANHTWNHVDLTRMDESHAYDALRRAHDAIGEVTGRTARLIRPPYGHLGGATLLAASRMGYELVFWSLQMREGSYAGNVAGHAAYIVRSVRPGTVLLAHDIGNAGRLVALNGLPAMIDGLREKGYEFVTVSQLMAAGAA